MKSNKMVVMNPFEGQEQRHIPREQTCGHSRGGSGWGEWRELALAYAHLEKEVATHWSVFITACKTDNEWDAAV